MDWRWARASALHGISWPGSDARPAEELGAGPVVHLTPDRVALVPVDAGDQVRVSGQQLQVGLASGTADSYPDVITWQALPTPPVVRIPLWSSARFLALRVASPEDVRVEVTARVFDALAAHRLDARVHAWLSGDVTEPPSARVSQHRRSALTMQALSQLWELALAGEAPTARRASRDARRLLHGFWLERRLKQDPLPAPFFVGQPTSPSGGRPVAPELDAALQPGTEWRLLRSGETLTLPSVGADVVSVQLRARAMGQTRVQIWNGELLAHDSLFQIPRRAESPDRFTPARVLRVTPKAQGTLRVVVVEGSARVHVEARRAEHGLLEQSATYRPSAAWRAARLPPDAPAWLSELAAFQIEGRRATLERLERRLGSAQLASAGTAPGGSDAQGAVTALLLYAALPSLVDRPSLVGELGRFWSLTAFLPPQRRTALRLSLVEQLQDVLPKPLHVETCPAAFDERREPASASGVEAQLLRASLETVLGTRDGQRPEPMMALEELAARSAGDSRSVELTRNAWSRGAPWAALGAPGASVRMLHRRPFDANDASGLCQNRGSRGQRWWIVPRTPTELEIQDLGGTHSALHLVALDPLALVGAEVQIDEELIRVQPGLGATSLVALRPGAHRIIQRSGGTLLARVPRLGVSPCEELLEMERWFALEQELVFQLPGSAGRSVASVIVDPTSLPEAGAALEVDVGGRRTLAWLRSPASGDVEVEVPAGATELRVRSELPLLVRARARMHPRAPRADAALDLRPDPPDVELLAELARLSAALSSSAPGGERHELRSQRAEALHALGYPELAEVDWARAARAGTARRKSASGALFLPEYPESVVPLGLPARAPLLPVADRELVLRALELERLGRAERALELLLGAGAAQASDISGLLTAELASDAGDAATAAPILERLAHAHENGALFEAAAREYDRLAAQAFNVEHARRAFLLAKLAARHGGHAEALLGRYDQSVAWRAPSLSTLGNSSVRVESPSLGAALPSRNSELRRALLVAPAGAWLLGAETSFSVRRWRGEALVVRSVCFNREGPEEGCQTEWFLDGEVVSCPAADVDTDIATPRDCTIQLGYHARELVARLPAGTPKLGWALFERFTAEDGGEAPRRTPLIWQESYAALGSDAPIRLHVSGPSALRVEARVLGPAAATLQLSARPLGEQRSPLSHPLVTQLLEVPATPDVATLGNALEESPKVSRPTRLEHVIVSPGLHEIMLAASAGTLLVRPEVADITSLPRAAGASAAALQPAVAPGASLSMTDASTPAFGVTAVDEMLTTGLLSLSAELTLRDRDLAEADDDAGDRHAETALVSRKALFDDRLWLSLAGFHRARSGAGSVGAQLTASSSPEGPWPGLFGSARVVSQPALEARGFLASIGARHRIPLSPRMNLLPALSWTWRATEPAASARADVDGDVYSAYAARRPYSLDMEAVVAHRPFTDLLGRYGLSARVNQDLRGFDRIELESELDLLPGAGLAPWLSLGLSASHRAASVLREHAFTRLQVAPRAMLWHWLGAGQRLRTELDLSMFVDVPNPSGRRAGVFASLLLGYDFWLGDGLGDFRASARFYRARLEENGPPRAPGSSANDTYWLEAPSP